MLNLVSPPLRRTDTALWISIMATQCPSWRPFPTLWIWPLSETCRRRVGWTGAHPETVERRAFTSNLVFFYTETCWDSLSWWNLGNHWMLWIKMRLWQTSASTSPLKAITVVYIFLYRRSWWFDLLWHGCCGLCTDHYFFVFPLVLLNWGLLVLRQLTTRGRCSRLTSFLPFKRYTYDVEAILACSMILNGGQSYVVFNAVM